MNILPDIAYEPIETSSLPTIILVLGIVFAVAAIAITLCVALVRNKKEKGK
ncbi:MAG: hypothetical protein IJJ86_03905 [Clostridia bacterium]|nr:hypothetical protein [Clostridia bacterium]